MKHQGQVVAYLRVSSEDQNLARQYELKDGADKVFEEKESAGTRNRPQLQEMLSYVREGDTVRVWSIDRFARSVRDLENMVHELKAKGVAIEFVQEGMTFDPSAESKEDPFKTLMFQQLGSYAQFERAVSRARQAEGIAKAKAAGKYKGRQPSLTAAQMDEAKERVAQGVPKAQVARDLGVSRQTLYRGLADQLKLRDERAA